MDSLSFNECAIEEVEQRFNTNLVTGESPKEIPSKLNITDKVVRKPKETIKKEKRNKKPAKTSKTTFHTVTTGDTRATISKKHNITISKLTSLNPKVNWKQLKSGMKIIVKIE